ncbi:hypothetical protein [Clostridium guangxiense]|nr:hypothetical protein [Clostridium guangxiense]MCD2346177.1 hypothetical protein [Clostridium guangxiense]
MSKKYYKYSLLALGAVVTTASSVLLNLGTNLGVIIGHYMFYVQQIHLLK